MSTTDCKAKTHKRIVCPWITEWMRVVEQEKQLVCQEQVMLVSYVRRVFAEEKLYIDTYRLEKYESYQKYFPFDLFHWEKFLFAISMTVFKEDGRPRWSQIFALLGRGSGKNGLISFIAFCLLTETNGIDRYNVDICATSEEQAKTSFFEVHDDVLENPKQARKMRNNFYWTREVIKNKKTRSELKYRTDNPKSKDGLRSGAVIFDEVHAYENWKNLNVFTTGLGKKPHPRRFYFTSEGNVCDGPLDSLKERAMRILKGEIADNGFFPFICRLDSKDEVHDRRCWVKSVPSLPFFPDVEEEMITEYGEYLEDPINNSEFMTKRMGLRESQTEIAVTSWENIKATSKEIPDLSGWECVLGLDLARTTDFISASLVFRRDEQYYAINHSWFCFNSPHRKAIKAPLDEWHNAGFITLVDDVEVPPEIVIDWVRAQMSLYSILGVALDSYRFSIFSRLLDDLGFSVKDKTIKLLRPSDIMLVQPRITSAFAKQRISWGNDPAMRWFTNNAKLEPAKNNNYTYGKIEPKSRKTDGFMAFVAGMCIEDMIPEFVPYEFFAPVFF